MSKVLMNDEGKDMRLQLPDGSASARLVPRLGLDQPRYHFHVGRVVHAAEELDMFRMQTTLLLGNDLTGHAELGELCFAPELGETQRIVAAHRLLEAAREQIAARPQDFGEQLVVELPGWRDKHGQSPFWQALGAHFCPLDPAATEAALGPGWRSQLATLLPRQTLYLAFLGEAAQRHLGQADAAARPLLRALLECGFQPSSHVRIDDGGPVMAWRVP